MKIVSSYVREQKRYTKNDLKTIFSFDESGVEKFIKNLKAYGVLKSVKNNTDQLEMSDLMDEDVEITDETRINVEIKYITSTSYNIDCTGINDFTHIKNLYKGSTQWVMKENDKFNSYTAKCVFFNSLCAVISLLPASGSNTNLYFEFKKFL